MKIVVTGAKGLLGFEIVERLKNRYTVFSFDIDINGIDLPDSNKFIVDITDAEKVYKEISKVNPDIVIHTAAMSDVDECERKPDLAFKINTLGTRNVAVACQRFDTLMCYISTDYVFSGEDMPESGYKEYDIPSPQGIYGKSKYQGELYVKELLNRFYIIRTSSLFGIRRKNFVSYIIDSALENKKIKVVVDQVTSPTYTPDLALAIETLIEKNIYGTYHITNSGGVSRFEMAKTILEILNSKIELIPVKREEIFFAKRPKNAILNNYLWKLNGLSPLRTWKEAVSDFITKYLAIKTRK